MPQSSYVYACARISALENGLLDRKTVKRMAAGSLKDAMRILLDARYGGIPDATAADCERMIENVRRQTALDIRELSPEPELTDLFLLATDIHNLKLLIKARLLEQGDVEFLEGGLYEREQLKTAVAEQDYRLLPRQLAEALNALEDRLKVEVQPQRVSVALDALPGEMLEGTVSSVSAVGTRAAAGAQFEVRVSLPEDARLLLGLSATAYFLED